MTDVRDNYVAVAPCGCWKAMIADDGEQDDRVQVFLKREVRRGNRIERFSTEVIRSVGFKRCKKHEERGRP